MAKKINKKKINQIPTSFYVLRQGDLFYVNRKKYRKINKDKGKVIGGKIKKFFWPLTAVKFLSNMTRDEFKDKYLDGELNMAV